MEPLQVVIDASLQKVSRKMHHRKLVGFSNFHLYQSQVQAQSLLLQQVPPLLRCCLLPLFLSCRDSQLCHRGGCCIAGCTSPEEHLSCRREELRASSIIPLLDSQKSP